MSRWQMAGVGAVAATALVVSACGSNNSGGGGGGGSSTGSSTTSAGKTNPGHSGPYRILDITSLTGPLGPFGNSELQGLKAAVRQLNAQGGINGHKIGSPVVPVGR